MMIFLFFEGVMVMMIAVIYIVSYPASVMIFLLYTGTSTSTLVYDHTENTET